MASANMPEGFWTEIEPLLPPEKVPSPSGGRPKVPNKVAMRGIFFVLLTGIRWEYLPKEIGCSGMTCWRRLKAWQELEIWDRLHRLLLDALRKAGKLDPTLVVIDSTTSRAGGRAGGRAAAGTRRSRTPRTAGNRAQNST